MNTPMTNDQIKARAIELFDQYGPHKTDHALYALVNEVEKSGRYFTYTGSNSFQIEQLALSVYPIPDFMKSDVLPLKELENKKATIVYSGDGGFCSAFLVTINNVTVRYSKQYGNFVVIQFTQKGKRKPIHIFVKPSTKVAVYNDHIVANTDSLSRVISKADGVKLVDMGFAMDDRHFNNAVNNISLKPIFIHNRVTSFDNEF